MAVQEWGVLPESPNGAVLPCVACIATPNHVHNVKHKVVVQIPVLAEFEETVVLEVGVRARRHSRSRCRRGDPHGGGGGRDRDRAGGGDDLEQSQCGFDVRGK